MEILLKFSNFCFLLMLLVNSVLTQVVVVPLSSPVERVALLDLRTSLGIRAKYWPRKAEPCSNWTGVECRNGVVTGINLFGLRRTKVGKQNPKFAIDSLVNCSQLVLFNSSGFYLPGNIPDWIGGKLNALQVLDLRSSSVLGPIPESIGSLNRLNQLLLSNNSITGNIPDSLKQLSNLSVLNLSFNMLTGSIPSSFSALGNLTILDLSSNSLSGPIPAELGLITSLQSLNLSNNSFTSSLPVEIANLSQLVDLDLSFNSLYGSLPKELGNLTRLKRLLIGHNDFGGNFTINLQDIIFLDVSSNNFSGNLPNLSAFINASGVMLNFSNNIFYGSLNSTMPNFNFVDLSNNYLQGLNAPIGNTIVASKNCFIQLENQRSFDDCKTFYNLRNLRFNDTSSTQPQPPISKKRNRRLTYVLAGVFGGLGIIIIVVLISVLVLKVCNKRGSSQRSANVEPVQEEVHGKGQDVTVDIISLTDSFRYDQMLQATNGFGELNLIKHGHSGDIFKGKLEDGSMVVIKRVDMRTSQKDCYMSELELYSKGMHTRLVPLLGHCLEHETEKLLVYKHMPNGDLSNSLYKSTSLDDSGLQSLDWITRLKIAIGAAEGLAYLHHECNPPLVHRDIQASSILLDDKYDVRLGSLSEVCGQGVDNNNQNVVTRLLRISSSSESTPSGSTPCTSAYDVYCFGKVLLELVTGKLGISDPEDTSIKEWVDQTLTFINNYDKESISKIIDQSLVIDEDLMDEVWAVAIVAKSCLNPKPAKRPQIRHILKALENPFRVIREEDFSSGRLRNNSSTRSWSAALFGSWRQSFSGSTNSQSQTNKDGNNGVKQTGRDNSQGSGGNDKRLSSEIFPEPVEVNDVEKQDETR